MLNHHRADNGSMSLSTSRVTNCDNHQRAPRLQELVDRQTQMKVFATWHSPSSMMVGVRSTLLHNGRPTTVSGINLRDERWEIESTPERCNAKNVNQQWRRKRSNANRWGMQYCFRVSVDQGEVKFYWWGEQRNISNICQRFGEKTKCQLTHCRVWLLGVGLLNHVTRY